jgi:hypothetical protein
MKHQGLQVYWISDSSKERDKFYIHPFFPMQNYLLGEMTQQPMRQMMIQLVSGREALYIAAAE